MRTLRILLCCTVFIFILNACSMPPLPTPETEQLPPTASSCPSPLPVSASPEPTPEPTPVPTPTPIPIPLDEAYRGVWLYGSEGYFILNEDGSGELFFAPLGAMEKSVWEYDPASGGIAFSGNTGSGTAFLRQEGESQILLVSLDDTDEVYPFSSGTEGEQLQIRLETGCAFWGDWDLYTVMEERTGMTVQIRSDGSCRLYGAEYEWRPGAEGMDNFEGISLYRNGKLRFALVGADFPMLDRAYLSEWEYGHWKSSAMLLRQSEP